MPRPSRQRDRRTRRRIPDNPRFARATDPGDGALEPVGAPQPLESEGIGGYGVDPAADPATRKAAA